MRTQIGQPRAKKAPQASKLPPMDRWFRQDPQAQEGFLNMGYIFIKDSEAPKIP